MSVPAGCIMAFGGSERDIPTNWLLCDGSEVSKDVYGDLFDAIGTSWGGDANPKFCLPDTRGYFLRGVDDGAGRDPDASDRTHQASGGHTGDEVGTVQEDEFASHHHSYGKTPNSRQTNAGSTKNAMNYRENEETDTGTTGGSSETRPKNVYVYFIIKATNDE